MRWAWILAVVLILIGLAPVIGIACAQMLSALADCPLNTAFPQPCVVFGADIGGTLTTLNSLNWLMFLTAPAALAGFALAIALALAALLRRARDR
ncbi:hypothetical protein [Pararhodobacter oceanensis]|uniref:hypothetical protein n=1 Tax=Pararhodobacter oceanensis TaxID=2172121 RepID=UPI003A93C335